MKDLLNHKWALAESYMTRHFDVYYHALKHGHTLGKKKKMKDLLSSVESLLSLAENEGHPPVSADVGPSVKMGYDQQSGLPIAVTGGKNIAIIPVIGPLTKYGELCSMGMQDYQQLLSRANASSSIDGIVFIMDTPGGTVDGTPEFGVAIKNSAKPVGVFGDCMVASAGMWLASQASVIVGNKNNPTEFGSIGVLMCLPNYQNMMEAGELPNVEIFRASQSKEKAIVNSIEPISDAGRQQVQEDLDAICSQFISAVKSGRGDALNTSAAGLFAGRMYDVYAAKQNGLIDSIGTLQTAVTKVAELAKQKASGNGSSGAQHLAHPSNEGTNQNANTMKFPKLSSLFGIKSKEAKEVTMKATSEGLQSEDTASLEAAEQKVADMEADTARLKQEATAKDEQITKLTATASEQTARITALEGEKSKLTEEKAELQKKVDAKPSGQATTIIVDENKNKNVNADGEGKTTEVVDSPATAKGKQIVADREKQKDLIV